MLVFIDESGDAGFKPGASDQLVMGAVVFDGPETAEAAGDVLSRLRLELEVAEFKFAKSHPGKRDRFFAAARDLEFRFYGIAVSKWDLAHRPDGVTFFRETMFDLVRAAGDGIDQARVKIDGDVSKRFQKATATHLRQTFPGRILGTKFVDSQKNVLVQLADMTTSAFALSRKPGARNATRWFDMMSPRVARIVLKP